MAPKRKKQPAPAPADGIHWERWENGVLIESGYQSPEGTFDQRRLHIGVPLRALEELLKQ
jgi:hypothetical protein